MVKDHSTNLQDVHHGQVWPSVIPRLELQASKREKLGILMKISSSLYVTCIKVCYNSTSNKGYMKGQRRRHYDN